ncbi:hypothetical protein [Pseudobutyrivibrio ruminis]|uniref:hypothetical protein n=1 Tax=Pseudobutyrivibrio ruminis TaxID=46206 RepID=UPI0003F71518|nr:hypothetical protein [Pseudobutyrivibrio ruminis]
MKIINKFIKSKYEIIVPIIHFLLSFAWQGKIFIGFGNWDMYATAVRNQNVISASGELHLVYLLSRLFCFFIILGWWKIIFFILHGNVNKSDMFILGSILLLGIVCGVILYPQFWGIEIDNYTNYLMAIRFQPTYWQSVYTGALYGGCLMVVPHPIAVFIVQWFFFWSVVSYIYLGIEKTCNNEDFKYISLLFFLLPESYHLTFNAYRNNFYTVLILLYISFIYFSVKKGEWLRGIKQTILFSLMATFVMVWRSEGILVGLAGIVVYFFAALSNKTKSQVKLYLLVPICISFVVLSQIQELGSKKYYGQDYMMLNTTNVLYSVFNNPNANLSYEDAEGDIKSIENIIPIEVLKEYGMGGYRSFNWNQGRQDFNQTMATDEQASSYMSAYYNIIIHNLATYLDVQINNFYKALQLPANRTTYVYDGDNTVELESFVYDKWQIGQNEINKTWNTEAWEKNQTRIALSVIINEVISVWQELIIKSGLNIIIHVVAILSVIVFFLKELLYCIDKKRKWKKGIPFIISFIVIFVEFLAVMLFMPEGRAAYLYPMLYASYFVLFLYYIENYQKA